ncbi:MAG: FAD-linked oxidase C-terminal domain-containing protein [Gammaproteobacteria bacterium]|nr:FAD-linked oxidase C-terminal domain-containing protein [Gammaproteobacteria bacterium]
MVKPKNEGLALLRHTFGDQYSEGTNTRQEHGAGEGYISDTLPDAVLMLDSTEAVARAVSICNEYSLPVIAFGAGTSLEGQLVAVNGGVSFDLTGMNQILEINTEDFDVKLQAGVTREALNYELKTSGLFFPLDPGANASLGGMASTRASGTNAVRYGTMKEVVLGLTVVTPNGDIIQTGGRARKSAAGYDLTHLYVGAEGTLGIITELRLRIFPVPEQIRAAVCSFPSVKLAAQCVIECMQLAVPLARIELLNSCQMGACIEYSKLQGFTAQPTLFIEFHGSKISVDEQITTVEAVAQGYQANDFRWAETLEERNQLWTARHKAYFAGLALNPGASVISTDVCVPISNLADCIELAESKAVELGFNCPLVGHVGDGNFHLLIPFWPDNPDQVRAAKQLSHYLVQQALALQGTCTGEHGIGLRKKAYLLEEHGAHAVSTMGLIKRALDPKNIMNPGKIFDLC